MAIRKFKDSAGVEKTIQNKIVDWLNLQRFVDIAFQNDQFPIPGRKLHNRFRPKGFSDVGGNFSGGRAFYIEVKRPHEDATKDQRKFLNQRRGCGTFAETVRSLEELQFLLRNEGYDC